MGCPIVLVCDASYAMPLATTLLSTVQSNKTSWPIKFYILVDRLNLSQKDNIEKSLPIGSAIIDWIDIDTGQFNELATLPHVSKVTFARLLIPTLIPNSVSRILYLDTDLLVLADLSELRNIDLEDCVVAAVTDKWDPKIKENALEGDLDLSKLPRVTEYFNAGVLLVDLQQWQERNLSRKALDYLSTNPRSLFSDQDALNVVCDGIWKKLDPRWNFQDHLEVRLSALPLEQRPAVVHFVGRAKPWKPSIPNVNAAFYDALRSQTRFARTPFDKAADFIARSRTRANFILWRSAAYRGFRAYVKSLLGLR